VAERIHEEVAAPLEVRGSEVFTSVSLGIALSSAGYGCPEDMLRDADTAMYRAKTRGRARHEVFAGDLHERASPRCSSRPSSDARSSAAKWSLTTNRSSIWRPVGWWGSRRSRVGGTRAGAYSCPNSSSPLRKTPG